MFVRGIKLLRPRFIVGDRVNIALTYNFTLKACGKFRDHVGSMDFYDLNLDTFFEQRWEGQTQADRKMPSLQPLQIIVC